MDLSKLDEEDLALIDNLSPKQLESLMQGLDLIRARLKGKAPADVPETMQKEQTMHEMNIDAMGASASGVKNQENAPTTTVLEGKRSSENMASALELVKGLLDEAPKAPDVVVVQNEPAKNTEEVVQSGSQASISRVRLRACSSSSLAISFFDRSHKFIVVFPYPTPSPFEMNFTKQMHLFNITLPQL
ncbi:hypothetical protein RIF29_15822 [Crotalaria pallida]|uniref:Uncharacterized protein n=1 Tax=Crotalaria pallida TaxID=3830 RepID=A0AAN9FJT2_CROPI